MSSTTDLSARWTTMLNGTRLRQLRLQHGLSQEALADRAGISLTTVARLERRPYGPARCRTLAAALSEPPAAIELSPATGTATRAGNPDFYQTSAHHADVVDLGDVRGGRSGEGRRG